VSMLILLPKDKTLDSVEKSISAEKLNEWRSLLEVKSVNVLMPKFRFDGKYSLAKDLAGMGMPAAFVPPTASSGANFSGMTGKNDLYISDVIHQTFVGVDEDGTEAAAATAVYHDTLGPVREERHVFIADHPFIFLIQDKATGTILFLGRVSDPTKG